MQWSLLSLFGIVAVASQPILHPLHEDAVRLKQASETAATPDAIQCGMVLKNSVVLTQDLNCPDSRDFALSVVGDNIHVDGGRDPITGRNFAVRAPNAKAGLYIQGSNVSITNLTVNGVTNGVGVFAFDAPGLELSHNDFSSNATGVKVYAENTSMNRVRILQNRITDSTEFGIRTGQDEKGAILNPLIQDNDLSRSGSYAIYLQAMSAELQGNQHNNLQDSTNGIMLVGGSFKVHDWSLRSNRIKKVQIFVDSASDVELTNLDTSSELQPLPSQENVGISLYGVARFEIKSLKCKGNDIGVKINRKTGVETDGRMRNSILSNHTFAGVMITSEDGTPFSGILDVRRNKITEKAPARDIYTNTTWREPSHSTLLEVSACPRETDL